LPCLPLGKKKKGTSALDRVGKEERYDLHITKCEKKKGGGRRSCASNRHVIKYKGRGPGRHGAE